MTECAVLPGCAPHLLQSGPFGPRPKISPVLCSHYIPVVRMCCFTGVRAPLVAIWALGAQTKNITRSLFPLHPGCLKEPGACPTCCNLDPLGPDPKHHQIFVPIRSRLFECAVSPGCAPHVLQSEPFGPRPKISPDLCSH